MTRVPTRKSLLPRYRTARKNSGIGGRETERLSTKTRKPASIALVAETPPRARTNAGVPTRIGIAADTTRASIIGDMIVKRPTRAEVEMNPSAEAKPSGSLGKASRNCDRVLLAPEILRFRPITQESIAMPRVRSQLYDLSADRLPFRPLDYRVDNRARFENNSV